MLLLLRTTTLSPFSTLSFIQSGLKSHRSTETALLRILDDILIATDSGNSVILVLVDLSSAFDTIDHTILLERLASYAGLGGTVLQLSLSLLTEHFSRKIGNILSTSVS